MEKITDAVMAEKPRYAILDGLRGVAAVIVVAFHLFEVYTQSPADQILNHGYLAVDFFFVLSGFVIGYAYDNRWGRMSTWDFFKRRLVRLHPMVIMGSAIGALLFYFAESERYTLIEQTAWWQVLLLFLLACTMLPAIPRWDIRGWQETNPLNGPTWSLMWEYLANLLYAVFVRRFSKVALSCFVLFAAFLTLDLTLNLDVFGLLANRDMAAAHTVIGGWSITAEQCYIGIVRLLYPFFGGLLLFRIGKLITVRAGFWWCSLLIVVALVMPHIGGETANWQNGAYNAFCILLLFPIIVAMGAGSQVRGKRSVTVCNYLGEISYPLYITHYPFVYLQSSWVTLHPDAPLSTQIFVGVSTFVLAVGVAHACLKLYDLPVRQWLKEKFLVKK